MNNITDNLLIFDHGNTKGIEHVELYPFQQKFIDEILKKQVLGIGRTVVVQRSQQRGISHLQQMVRNNAEISVCSVSEVRHRDIVDALAVLDDACESIVPPSTMKYLPVYKNNYPRGPIHLSNLSTVAKLHGDQLRKKLCR